MVFNSPAQLKGQIMVQMESAIKEAENKIHDVIDKFLKQYYSEYSPSVYHRTYQLLHSLVKSDIVRKTNGYYCHVYFDLDKIDYSIKYINGRPYHNDITKVGGKEGIVALAMKSHTHGGYVANQNTAIWIESMQDLDAHKIEILRQGLIDNGIPLE